MSARADAALALATLTPGFADPVHDAQAVFRTLLDALARPGTRGAIDVPLPAVQGDETSTTTETGEADKTDTAQNARKTRETDHADGADKSGATRAATTSPAAFAALLTLCDFATPVWLAQPDAALAAALRFHTGAPLADSAREAAFAYVHEAASLPPLDQFACGTPQSPEGAATVFVRVAALTGGAPLTLTGPGIEHARAFAPVGLPGRFWPERAALAPLFPCSPDFYFVCGAALVGLPRTTVAVPANHAGENRCTSP